MPTASLQWNRTPAPIKCPGYDIKPSDGEASVLELLEMWSYSFVAITPRSTLTQSGSTS